MPGGLVASQEVIETLGTNGGGFYDVGSAHPLAGSIAGARIHAPTSATLRSSGATFGLLLLFVIVMVGGLTYLPSLALGPLAER